MTAFRRSLLTLFIAALGFLVFPASGYAQAVRGVELNCPARQHGYPNTLSFAVFQTSGLRILVMAGGISYGDDVRLSSFLRGAGRIDEVWMDSPGGDASVGPKIGRIIRHANLATRVPAGFQCHSSCTLAFLGGVVRNIEPGGAYGVHTFYNRNALSDILEVLTSNEPPAERERKLREQLHQREQRNALLAAEWQVYIQEMGISRRFLVEQVIPQQSMNFATLEQIRQWQNQGATQEQIERRISTIRCLDRQTLVEYNVVNVE